MASRKASMTWIVFKRYADDTDLFMSYQKLLEASLKGLTIQTHHNSKVWMTKKLLQSGKVPLEKIQTG